MKTKRMRAQIAVVVEFPEEMSDLPEGTGSAETLGALYDGLTAAVSRAYGVEVERVSGEHDIRLVFAERQSRR